MRRMDLFTLDAASILGLLLILMRITVVMFMLPFFGGDTHPPQVKFALSLVLALVLWRHVPEMSHLLPAHPASIIVMFAAEFLMGLTLGLTVHFLFAGIQTGGQIIGFQMGFSMLTFADPLSGQSIGITSHLLYMVAMMVFLCLNGHLIMLHGFAESFSLAPPGMLLMRPPLFEEILHLSGGMFLVAIKIAGPVICALFLIELALGLMSRAAPQMHLITIGLPVKIGVGFFFLGLLFTMMTLLVEDFIIDLKPMFSAILRSLGGG